MHNLFHYEREGSPTYECMRELKRAGVDTKDHLLPEALDQYFRSRLVLRTNRKRAKAAHPLWRLTIPLWALAFVLIAFVVLPVRWMLTGEYKLSHTSNAFHWLRAWHQQLFPWPKP